MELLMDVQQELLQLVFSLVQHVKMDGSLLVQTPTVQLFVKLTVLFALLLKHALQLLLDTF